MKQNGKPKPDDGAGFDDAGHVEQTTGFDDLAATLGLLGITPDQWAAAHTKAKATWLLKSKGLPQAEIAGLLRDVSLDDPEHEREAQAKVAAWASPERRAQVTAALAGLGFEPNEQAVVLAVACDGLTVWRKGEKKSKPNHAAVARATKLHRHTVENILKRPSVRDVLATLERGALPAPQPAPSDTGDGWRLDTLADYARREIERVAQRTGPDVLGGWLRKLGVAPAGPRRAWTGTKKTKPQGAAVVVDFVKRYPATLLHPEGRLLLEGLVDLLEAAKTGNPARRVAGLLPKGKGKRLARAAKAELAALGKGEYCEPLDYPPDLLARLLGLFRERVGQLQAEFQRLKGDNLVARFSGAHGAELRGFKTDSQLATLLRGDPLTVAAGLAEKATGVSAETCLRCRVELLTPHQRRAEKHRKP